MRGKAFLLAISILAGWSSLRAQYGDIQYEHIRVAENKYLFSSLAFSPSGNELALSTTQGHPLYILQPKEFSPQKTLDAGNWYAGSRLKYSPSGKFLLLQQLFYLDFAPNTDRKVAFEVIEVETGKKILNLSDCHDAKISPDESKVYSLSKDEITEWELSTGNLLRKWPVTNAANCIEISPNGQWLVLSVHPTVEDLQPRFGKDKKAIKMAVHSRQQVRVYELKTGKPIKLIDELYDLIFSLEFSKNGDYLFLFAAPHTRQKGKTLSKQNFIQVIQTNNWEPDRRIFPSSSPYQPDFRLSEDGNWFFIGSQGRYPEIHRYNFSTARLENRFELSSRIWENISQGEFPGDGRVSFDLIPGSENILMTFGNTLILWKP